LFVHRECKSVSTQLRRELSLACNICRYSLSILVALSLLGSPAAHCQESGTPAEYQTPVKPPVEREIVWEGLASYGNYSLFATEDMTKLYTSGLEYDRHSWGYFLRARMDYVAEFLPFVLLDEPADTNYFGDPDVPLSPNRKLVPGVGFSPIGLRMIWRDGKAIKPYILLKGGLLVFDQKAISSHAAYANFSLQSGFGVQTRLTKRVDLRLGLWGDFHFSDGFIVPVNPGTDVMNANWGISYHLGPPQAKSGRRHRFPRL
jgi:hypothetical protein